LAQDVKLQQGLKDDGGRFLEVRLKCPKENKTGKAVVVEVFESQGAICPVRAFDKWASKNQVETGFPCFRHKNGVPLTGRALNNILKKLLEPHVSYEKGKFTTHSFRIGLATTLGTLGFNNEEVKKAGRWSSNAYEVYMKLPRTQRSAVAKKIGQL
jgi:hypothetical protein